MRIYIVKITSQKIVEQILAGNDFVHDGIYNFENEIKLDDGVFIYLGGDKSQINWEQGIRAFGQVIKKPYDKGYDINKSRNFKISIRPIHILADSIPAKYTKIHPKYANSIYNVPYIGAKHFPNQAIGSTHNINEVKSLCQIYLEKCNGYDFDVVLSEFVKRKYLDKISNNKELLSNFNKYLKTTPFIFKSKISNKLVKSLLAKQFLILTGKSGTGKTKLAQLFCSYLDTNVYSKQSSLLSKALADKQLRTKYDIIREDDISIEVINKNGRSGKIIPLPKNIIYEWFREFSKGNLTDQTPPKDYKDNFDKLSEYQKHSHYYYSNIFDIAKVMYRHDTTSDVNNTTIASYVILPVGADWVDNKPIMGFYNPLAEIYQSTPALDLILDAIKQPDRPFFLILDEMNLSHVERYFSDFLSAIESNEPVPLHTNRKAVNGSSGKMVPRELKIPDNLFIIGTVNIDETTYMFSPKVLDRANVIEFRVNEDDLEAFFNHSSNSLEMIEQVVGRDREFLSIAHELKQKNSSIDKLSESILEQVKKHLKDIFRILSFIESEFAYRTIEEIVRYIRVSQYFTEEKDQWSPIDALDEQILQKILPKLHGSRRKIERLLLTLASYCYNPNNNDLKNLNKYFEIASSLDITNSSVDAIFKESYDKLIKMIENVRRDQFVSFIQ